MRRDGELEAKSARGPSMSRADAANLARGLQFARTHGEIHRLRQIELAIAVAVWTGKAEVRRSRRVKDRDLRRRKEFRVVAEIEIDLQRSEAGITYAQCGRCNTSATLAFAHRLPPYGSSSVREPHDA